MILNLASMCQWLSPEALNMIQSGQAKKYFQNAAPYPHLILDNFLNNPAYLRLLQLTANSPKAPNQSKYGLSLGRKILWGAFTDIQFLRFLFNEFRLCLEDILSEPVRPRAGQIPQITEFLPYSKGFDCHNDEKESFDLVMLLYMNPVDACPDGGYFCLHNPDGAIIKQVAPKANRLLLFKVAHNSHHSVSDMGSQPRTNLTIDWTLPKSARSQLRQERAI